MVLSAFMVLTSFNWVHILVLLTIPAFVAVSYFVFKKRSMKAKSIFIWVLMAIVAAGYVITFTIDCFVNPIHIPTILARLPLHLCGINVFLYPLGFALRKNKYNEVRRCSLSYIYFVGSPGALLGALMPPGDCQGASIFTYNIFVYFLKHNLIFIIPFLLVALGFYRPKWSDMVRAFTVLLCLLSVIHVVNLIFSAIGGYRVNYFYTRWHDDNPILSVFWSVVPLEYFYMFLCACLLIPLFAVYYLPFLYYDIKAAKLKREAKLAA